MNLIDRTRTYFRASKDELMAVTWPTRQDIIRYTGLVIGTVLVFGLFFSGLDFVINTGIQAIIANKNATSNQVTPATTSTTQVEVNPVEVDATTPTGAPADIKVEQVPVTPNTAPTTGTSSGN